MEMYKKAVFANLRTPTKKGMLTTEQLKDLSIDELDELAVSLEVEHKQSGKKTFLAKKSEKDEMAKLRFDIVYDILITKVAQAQAATKSQEDKEHNKKIFALIEEKDGEELKGKSKKQLLAMIK